MSASRPPGQAEPSGRPGRYQRSTGGLVGAMVATLVAVAVIWGSQVLRDRPSNPASTVDYREVAAAAAADGTLRVLVPQPLPEGWRATSATYLPGGTPSWHLGLLTGAQRYVGVEESLASVEDLAQEHVDPDARRGRDVTIGGETWQTWTDEGGDYAVGRSAGPRQGSWLVVGTAPPEQVRTLAARLQPAEPPRRQ